MSVYFAEAGTGTARQRLRDMVFWYHVAKEEIFSCPPEKFVGPSPIEPKKALFLNVKIHNF